MAYAFGLKSPRHLLDKARREITRLQDATAQPPSEQQLQDVEDSAFNAAITLWHITDWIATSDDLKAAAVIDHIRRTRPSTQNEPYIILRDFVCDDSHMSLCRSLANGAKHFKLAREPAFDASQILFTATSNPIQDGTATYSVRADSTVAAGVSIAAPATGYFAKIIVDEAHSIPALEFFLIVLKYWIEFFETHKL